MTAREQNDYLMRLCQDLIRVRSYSGEEEAIVRKLQQVFQEIGCQDIHIDGYGSIVGRFKGKRPGRKVLFDSHVDTVPVSDPEAWSVDPFGGVREGGRIYGRGASDMKGALAAVIAAVKAFTADNGSDFAGEILVSGVVQEESFEGVAAREISRRFQPDCVVIGEASDLNLKRGQRGRAEIVLESFGQAAHSANPRAGVNAVYKIMELIRAIQELPLNQHPELGEGTLELTDIKSSPYPGLSVVPDHCRVTYDRRLLVQETQEAVLAQIQEVLGKSKATDPGIKARVSYAKGGEQCYTGKEIRTERFFPAWLLDEDDAFVRIAGQGLRAVGLDPKLTVYSFCTNGSHYAGEAGIKTLGFGPSTESQAHVRDEYIEVSQLLAACKGYQGLMQVLLQEHPDPTPAH